jgi:hypothetical protein
MRPLRPFRSSPVRSTDPAEGSLEDGGLQAFAPETSSEVAAETPQTPEPEQPAAPPSESRSRVVMGLLVVVVLLQAVPTVLWIKGQFGQSSAGAITASAVTPSPPAITPAPPCEPVAAPATPGPAAVPPAVAARPASGPVAAAPAPAILAGLMSVTAPVPLQVYVRGRLVGTTEAETIMLPVGTHEVEFRNDAVGYRARRSVTVQAGRTTATRLEMPAGTMHVNAVPWADVWIDNRRIGETPIGNLSISIGSHEVIFRHPELGERRTTVLVTLKEPARVSMDLRQK